MSTHDWKKIEELFGDALALPPQQRPAFLGERCGAESDLRRVVEYLLENDARAGAGFLRTPPPDPRLDAILTDQQPDELLGWTVGSCQIKKVLAHGGMGTVYLADQFKPEREVALKVLHGGLWSRSAERRFEYESQVLARLHHPNIAQVYEAGTAHVGDNETRTLPYFVMEYVPDARTITQYAEENGLSTRERLELFVPVCEAIQHGHQKGIIHRDVKPGNVLVDSSGQVKIIDFGVARSVDSDVAVTTMHTAAGDLIGTLAYMSPEQCDADPLGIDTRSDVYALGVVLYELICGKLPYDVSNASLTAAARVVREQTPQRPGTIDPKLRGDLETIALKALEKDRERRYASAADLAQDIRRYMNREPIEARPPSVWARIPRWLARHPVITTTTVCSGVAGLLIAAMWISVWFLFARPHRLEISKDGREARLLTFSSKLLHSWLAESPGGITFAELVERPAEFSGGQLALLGFSRFCKEPLRGSLCAFDVHGNLEMPLWKKCIEPDDILPELRAERGSAAQEYSVHLGWVFDVFPGRPGEEIVLCYGRGLYSQRALRIYDLSGDLLYQVWHDGEMGSCYWMSAAGLLVFAGDDHAPYWDNDRLLGDGVKVCDKVVFALRPVPDSINKTHFLNDPDHLPPVPADDPGGPVRYLRLRPEDAAGTVQRITVSPPDPPNDPDRCVRCDVLVSDQPRAAVWWVVDEHGKEVQGTREWGDNYKSNRLRFPEGDDRRLPDPDDFQLGTFPPIVEESRPAENAPDPGP